MIRPEPIGKLGDTLIHTCRGTKADITNPFRCVRVRYRDVSRLHGTQFFSGSFAKLLFKQFDDMQQLLRITITDVVNFLGG